MSPKKLLPKIVIDPGHGGEDPGTSGGGHKEKDLVLAYAEMLGHFLRVAGYTVEFTRNQDVTLTETYRKTVVSKGDILISCHLNGVTNQSAQGASIFYRSGINESKEIAASVFSEIQRLKYFRKYSTGVIGDKTLHRTGLYMLRAAEQRGCKLCMLLEPGFLTNITDRSVHTTEKTRNLLAKAIATGIDTYIKRNIL